MKNNRPNPAYDSDKLQSAFSSPLLNWYRRNRRDLPWRKTKDPYAILVSEVMLQQTQVKTVVPYYLRWMKRYPTLQSLAQASEADVLKSWEGLGYYRRARLLRAAALFIVEELNGQFPTSSEGIAALPGVGRYTLGALASIAFNIPMPVLDGNVIRVLCRWFEIGGDTRRAAMRKPMWKLATILISQDAPGDFNQALMELGATLCIPHKPLCLICPIRDSCRALAAGSQEQLPRALPRPAIVRQFEYAGLVIRDNKALLCQRRGGERMERLWQFPSVILPKPSSGWFGRWKRRFGNARNTEKIGILNYSVTHHRIRLELYLVSGFRRYKQAGAQWVGPSQIAELPFTAAHRKLADRFLASH